jgi:hypothetical protein
LVWQAAKKISSVSRYFSRDSSIDLRPKIWLSIGDTPRPTPSSSLPLER